MTPKQSPEERAREYTDVALCGESIDEEHVVHNAFLAGFASGIQEAEVLVEALEFYHKGKWSDGYPGGIKEEHKGKTYLDFGERAYEALEAYRASSKRGGKGD